MNAVKVIDSLGLGFWFENYKWYRKAKGGIWLKYWVDFPVAAEVWHNVAEFDGVTLPTALCRGIPRMEVYA